MEFNIEVNQRQIPVQEGETLLQALRRHGFRIPTLCHMNRFSPTGACRLCVVEVEGKRDLVTSCSYPVERDMKVTTNSKRVMRARKALVELLLAGHPDDCLYCQRNGNCELQWLASEMNVKERRFFGQKINQYPDHSSTSVFRDPDKCVLCGRCVRMCEEVQLVNAIDFVGRAHETSINSAFNQGLNVSSCISCGQCIMVCPTAALLDISHIEKVQAAIDHPDKEVAFMISPAALASVAEHIGMKASTELFGMMVAALRKCGVDRIYHMGYASDMHILNEARILNERLSDEKSAKILFSSCCPSWVRYVESFRAEWKDFLSPVKSPQQLMGNMVKKQAESLNEAKAEKVYTVSVTPCVANKYEASREENTRKGISEVDAVLSVRELLRFFRSFGLDLTSMEPETPDAPFKESSSAAWKMGYAGGKAEAVAREVFSLQTNDTDSFRFHVAKNQTIRRESRVQAGKHSLGLAWVSGIAEADTYIESLLQDKERQIHYVEVMACLGGCKAGGGQPISRDPGKPLNRKKICTEMEKLCAYRSAGEHARIAGWSIKDGKKPTE